jgi:GDSL-like Lipase/Acylhydrolase family
MAAFFYRENQKTQDTDIISTPTITSKAIDSTPTQGVFTTYTPPKITNKQVYKIAMIGDSMTVALGPHGGGFSEYINALYKKKETDPQRIIIDNYAKSSNILAVNDQLSKKKTISEYTFGPLLSEDYDLILVESYGYNPLSQYGVDEGIKKQNESLDKLMQKIITSRPHAAIVFVATISPNLQNFAKMTQSDKPETQRMEQAQERIAYLKNHIEYAKKHNIPLVNIYEKSLTPIGDGNMEYIDPSDDIHPSAEGVIFIGKELGDFIHSQQILPQ